MKKIELDIIALDCLLNMFEESGFIPYESFRRCDRGLVADEDKMLSTLVEEGLLKQEPYGYQITAKGIVFQHKGGFAALARRERRDLIIAVSTAVCSLIAAVASIVALFK